MLVPVKNNFEVLPAEKCNTPLVEIRAVLAQVKATEQAQYPAWLFAIRRARFCADAARYAGARYRRPGLTVSEKQTAPK